MLYGYLKEAIDVCGELKPEYAKEMFIRISKDYFKANIDLDCFSTLATQLYFELYKPHQLDAYDSELSRTLSHAAELSWYYKHRKDEKPNLSMYNRSIEILKKYYQANFGWLKEKLKD